MTAFFRDHKWLAAGGILLLLVLCILLAVLLFLKFWPAFGGRASKEDRQNYAERADNYRDGRFYNDGDFQLIQKSQKKDNKIMSTKETEPQAELPSKTPSFEEQPGEDEVRVTWFGHSSLLLQMHGMNLLIDPIFSERTSPVSFAGPKRFSRAPVTAEELPHIDILLISHDHYDHLDYETIQEIDQKVDRYLVPLGVENHLERWGVKADKIRNMAWWEEITVEGLTVGCTPARHFSGRSLGDQFETLWASWVFRDERYQVFESGDTGYGNHFQEIHDKYGDFDFVMIDCAQYDRKWPEVHMVPEEAAQAVQILGAQTAMPIHWAAVALANHPWDDSAERFTAAGESSGFEVITPYLGETVKPEQAEEYQEWWWREIP